MVLFKILRIHTSATLALLTAFQIYIQVFGWTGNRLSNLISRVRAVLTYYEVLGKILKVENWKAEIEKLCCKVNVYPLFNFQHFGTKKLQPRNDLTDYHIQWLIARTFRALLRKAVGRARVVDTCIYIFHSFIWITLSWPQTISLSEDDSWIRRLSNQGKELELGRSVAIWCETEQCSTAKRVLNGDYESVKCSERTSGRLVLADRSLYKRWKELAISRSYFTVSWQGRKAGMEWRINTSAQQPCHSWG